MPQSTTITFFKFEGGANKLWALSMMGLAHSSLGKAPGQTFYKLMGSGSGTSFNAFPDWSTYVLLQVWDNDQDADAFFAASVIMRQYRQRCAEVWTTYLKNTSAHGQWNGGNPFEKADPTAGSGPVIVLTRATIKWHKVITFWRYVPRSQQALKGNEGLLFTKGVGEMPVFQMATISVWKDEESVKRFAYQSAGHQEAIRKTRALKWYNEELFARFVPYKSVGQWNGREQLADLEMLNC